MITLAVNVTACVQFGRVAKEFYAISKKSSMPLYTITRKSVPVTET